MSSTICHGPGEVRLWGGVRLRGSQKSRPQKFCSSTATICGSTALNRPMLFTGLALITSARFQPLLVPSLTKADHLAKVSGPYLERPLSLSWTKIMFFFSLYMENELSFRLSSSSTERRVVAAHTRESLRILHSRSFHSCRITGAKGDRNIHASVSEQLKKNFAKSRWKVRIRAERRNIFLTLQARERPTATLPAPPARSLPRGRLPFQGVESQDCP